MSAPSVVVLDYGFENVRSAVRALERVGADVELTNDRAAAESADGLVVPGVGAFAAVMEGLRAVRGDQIVGRRLAGGRPVLGICVGMQVMFEAGDEHGVHRRSGSGPASSTACMPRWSRMGWATVEAPRGHGSSSRASRTSASTSCSCAAQAFALRSRTKPADGRFRPPLVTWASRRPLRRSRRERPAQRDASSTRRTGDAGAQLLTNWLSSLR